MSDVENKKDNISPSEKAIQDLNSNSLDTASGGSRVVKSVMAEDDGEHSFDESKLEIPVHKGHVKVKPEYTDNNVILSVNHLKVFFPMGKMGHKFYLKAVHNTNFQIHKGEVFGLVGESGCGKSTTGRSIIRLEQITSGSIYYKGVRIAAGDRWNRKEIKWSKIKGEAKIKEIKADSSLSQAEKDEQISKIKKFITNTKIQQEARIRQIHYDNTHVDKRLMSEIQMIFQDPIDSLDPRMTVEDIIQEGLKIKGSYNKKKNHEKVVEALEEVGLIPDFCSRYPHEFSGGQRQRIGIARALTVQPKLIIADEPVSALDVSIQAQVLNLLQQLQKDFNLTYLFISHDLSVVEMISDRIGVMYLGTIVETAPKKELYANPRHPYTRALLSAVPIPDPEVKKERITLKGDLPSPSNPPSGCLFHTRCPHCTEKCKTQVPTPVEIAPGHIVKCHYPELTE